MVKNKQLEKKSKIFKQSQIPKNYSLQNTEDFHKELKIESTASYISLFDKLIGEFIELSCDNINVQNIEYLRFIIIKGVKTVLHVFTFLLMYTKNISIVNYFCEKGFYYYNEFIGQIDDINHSKINIFKL